jgi:hypothetical protein
VEGVEEQEEGKTWAFGDEVVEAEVVEVVEVEGVEEQEEAVLQGNALGSAHSDHDPLDDGCSQEAHTNCGYQHRDPQQQHLHGGLLACVP